MSDESLAIPKQVEYVFISPRRKRMQLWGALLVAILGLGVMGVLMVFSTQNKPHVYSPLSLPAVGLNASLRTKSVGESVHYIFEVRPADGTEARFASVVRTVPREQLHFDIHFLDSDGFEICSESPITQAIVKADGSPDGLRADQAMKNCNEEKLQKASRWHVSYKFPQLTADLSQFAVTSPTESVARSQLTGKDYFTGAVETVDQGSFEVTKRAEFMTLLGWQPPDLLKISCMQKACLITNLRTHESVHAQKQ